MTNKYIHVDVGQKVSGICLDMTDIPVGAKVLYRCGVDMKCYECVVTTINGSRALRPCGCKNLFFWGQGDIELIAL